MLDGYGYPGPVREVLDAVRARVEGHARDVRTLAADGDPLFIRLVESGVADGLDRARSELDRDRTLWRA